MQQYLVKEKFILSVLNNPALNMGLEMRPGDTLLYDGYNVQVGKIQDVSITLKSAINAKWLVPISSDVESSAPLAMQPPPSSSVEEANPVVARVSVPANSTNNNGKLIHSEATAPIRNMPVSEPEGSVVRNTAYNDAGSRTNMTTQAPAQRTKLALSEEGDFEVVASVSTNRGEVTSLAKGSAAVESQQSLSRGVTSRAKLTLEESTSMDEVVGGLRRQVPAKAPPLEVTTASPRTEEAMDRSVYKTAKMEYAVSSAIVPPAEDMSLTEAGGYGTVIEDGQEKENRRLATLDFERQKAERIAARKLILQGAVVPPPPPSPTGENTVDGLTYKMMVEAGWTDGQLLGSKYASLVPAKAVVAPPPPPAPVAPPPPAPEVSSAAPSEKKEESAKEEVAVIGFPEGWDNLSLDEKVHLAETTEDKALLKFLSEVIKIHWKVKKAAKARLAA